MDRLKAIILLLINSLVWTVAFILTLPMVFIVWLKRVFIHSK